MSLKTANKERMQALCYLIRLYGAESCIDEIDKFLTERKLNPHKQEHRENITELFEHVEKNL